MGKLKTIRLATVKEVFSVPLPEQQTAALVFLQVEYVEADPEWYALPLTVASGGQAERLRESGLAEICLADGSPHGLLGEAFAVPAFARALLALLRNRSRLRHPRGEIEATRTAALRQIMNDEALPDPVIHNTAGRQRRAVLAGSWRSNSSDGL